MSASLEETPDVDPSAMLVEGHPLRERGQLTATWRRWTMPDGRVRWTWRVTWGANSCRQGA